MTRNHIGVDLSKDALDVFDPIRGEARIPNQPKAIAGWAARLDPETMVVFEATSGCDRGAA
jgi:transposase